MAPCGRTAKGICRLSARRETCSDAGDTNFYSYVLGDPINLIDPHGLKGLIPSLDDLITFKPGDFANQVSGGGDAAQILALQATVQSLTNQVLDIRRKKAEMLENKCKPDDPLLQALEALDRTLSDQIKNLKALANHIHLHNTALQHKPAPYPNPYGPISSPHA
jgi:hypothetical protein